MKLKLLIQTAGVAALAFVGLVGTQLYNTTKETDQALEKAIQAWSISNPDGAKAVARYKEVCYRSGPTEVTEPPTRPLTLAECTALIGNDSLAEEILKAVDSVEPPTPLRWL